MPPPPPTSEADIFGEAVSKGENFGKYHRTQVRCTPEGKHDQHLLDLCSIRIPF